MPGIVACVQVKLILREKESSVLSDRDETSGCGAINEKFHITRF